MPVRTRVGHSFIKAEMARTDAVFGGEHSAHYYFRDFWFADTGMLAAMHVLAALGEQDRPLSELPRRTSATSPPVRSTRGGRSAAAMARWPPRMPGAMTCRRLDGLTVACRTGGSTCGVEHGAAAAAQRGGADRATMERFVTRCSPRGAETPPPSYFERSRGVPLDSRLLEILACPHCHAPLADDSAAELACTSATAGCVSGPRRYPGAAGRRGPPAVDGAGGSAATRPTSRPR